MVWSELGGLSIEGRVLMDMGSERGGMFSESAEGSGGFEGATRWFGLLRRAHTESMSIVAPDVLGRFDFLASSL